MNPSNRKTQRGKPKGIKFVVDIRYQQNNSWQGSIQRLDSGETINFRSELELLTLMESAVSQQRKLSGENETLRKWSKKPKEVEATRPTKPIPALK